MYHRNGARQQSKVCFPEIAGDIILLQTVDSTQLEAKRLLQKGQKPPFTVMAEQQTAGVGRFNRTWYSPRGGIYLTWCTHNPNKDGITLVMAIAIKFALEKRSDNKFKIKWPNDILMNNKKVAGILVERLDNALLIGVGINTFPKILFDSEYNRVADTLELGSGERIHLVADFFYEIEKIWNRFCKNGFGLFKKTFLLNTFEIGTFMKLREREKDKIISGRFAGIEESGRLILETESGIISFCSGEISIYKE